MEDALGENIQKKLISGNLILLQIDFYSTDSEQFGHSYFWMFYYESPIQVSKKVSVNGA